MKSADVIVVGLGAMGSAATYQLAKRGVRVLGIDQFAPPHDRGSSHGETRITRQAIGEGQDYVPFVLRSQQIWREIEAETGQSLFLQCGALILGPSTDTAMHHGKPSFLGRTFEAARSFAIPHEDLTAAEVVRRFPQFNLAGHERGYFEEGGGVLFPERCVGSQLDLARRHGARIHVDERILKVEPGAGSVRVTTDRDVYEADRIVLAAGAWMPGLVEAPLAALTVHRQVLFWFEAQRPELFDPERCPVYIWMHGNRSEEYFYGFPMVPGAAGVKVATERYGFPLAGPDAIDRDVTDLEADAMYAAHIGGRLNDVAGRCLRKASCFYTVTPDRDFVIDRHPDSDRIMLISACSGHGFKHSSAIGESVAGLVCGERSDRAIASFNLARLATARDAEAAAG